VKAISSAYKALTSGESYNVEFHPLPNIIHSNNIEYNMKTAALDQIIYLVNMDKYRRSFIEEVFIHLVQDVTKLLVSLEEYGPDVLNYISSSMKVIDMIILFNLENPAMQEFLRSDSDNSGGWLLTRNLISKVIFSKGTSRHLLSTFAITYIYIFCFNKLPEDLTIEKTNTKAFSLLSLFEKSYLSILPITDYKPFFSSEQAFWEKLTVNKYIMDYIKTSEKSTQYIFDIVALRRAMKKILLIRMVNSAILIYTTLLFDTLTIFCIPVSVGLSSIRIVIVTSCYWLTL
jgi:hypothetical protein